MHGTEAIIPLAPSKRSDAARVLQQVAGIMGQDAPVGMAAPVYNVNVMIPAGTMMAGTAQELGSMIAPYVGRALSRGSTRAERRR